MSQIKTNTAALQELLNTAANLPEPVDTSDATANSSKILSGYTAYVKDKLIAGNIPNRTANDLSVNGATVTVPAGNYADDVSKSVHNNGVITETMDGINTKSISIPAGYTSGGTVGLDNSIDNAVADAITALTDKGVEVPDGTNVTGLAALIAAIESGGGNIAYGTITPSSTGSGVTITHNLGAVPTTGIFIKMTNDAASSTSDMYGLFQSSDTGIGIFSYKSSIYLRNANNSLTQATALTYNFNRADANTVKTPTVIIAGKTYFWVLMV